MKKERSDTFQGRDLVLLLLPLQQALDSLPECSVTYPGRKPHELPKHW